MLQPEPSSSTGQFNQPHSFPAHQSQSPPSEPSQSQSQGTPGGSFTPRPPKPSLWHWVSTKELIFVLVVCSFGVLLFRKKDAIQLVPVWHEQLDLSHYSNSKFPNDNEKLPPPIATDLDSDGSTDLLLLTYDNVLKLFNFPSVTNAFKSQEANQAMGGEAAVIDLGDYVGTGVGPVAMKTGYLQKYQSMVQVRHQVIVVLMSDWTVYCLDHNLKILWRIKVTSKDTKSISVSEAAIMISPVSLRKGDYGSVIVGGRERDLLRLQESVDRMRRVVNAKNEQQMLNTLGHYTMYALEGRGGEMRWHHTPQDFQVEPAYPPDSSSFQHMKLVMFKRNHHYGEVSWHQYSAAIRDSLPHTWQFSTDTHFTLAHFKKDRRRSEKSEMTDHISKVGDLAVDHMAGLAFGGQRPHSPSEHVQDPNVLILHSIKGVEVMHLYLGRPLCSVPLSPYHSSHADINADGVIDHVSAIHNPGEAGFSDADVNSDCYGKATPMNIASKPLFKHSICKATHWSERFLTMDKWIPQLSTAGRKVVDNKLTEPLAPILIPSWYHSTPLKLHLSGIGWDVDSLKETVVSPSPYLPPFTSSSSVGTYYDSVFVLSSGRVTSIGPHGEFNWQVDTVADWDSASHVIYDPSHHLWQSEPEKIQFLHDSFTPSAVAFSPKVYGKKDHVLILGWDSLVLLSGEEGETISAIHHIEDCHPVAPIQVADFTGDGWNDIIVTCPDRYQGISLIRRSGLWQTTLLSVFVGVVMVIFAVYTRQRTIGVLPPVKSD